MAGVVTSSPPVEPLKRASKASPVSQPVSAADAANAHLAVKTPSPSTAKPVPFRSTGRDDRVRDEEEDEDDDDGIMDTPASSIALSPASVGDTPSPFAHLSRLGRAAFDRTGTREKSFDGGATHPHRVGAHLLNPIPAWSPGLRGRTARNREVLLVARNAREQAKENEFLRTRVRELELELAESGDRMRRVMAAVDAGERAVGASADSVRQLEARLEGAKGREVALRAEAAAHAAAAEQLTLELERMRAIEEQTSLEAAQLIQKTSRLQNELNASARQAAIAEEMLAGVQVEGDRALEASERAMMELQRRLRELEAGSFAEGTTDWSAVAGDLAALLDQAMGEAAGLREAVALAASEAGRWRAEASRAEAEREHSITAIERAHNAAVAELKALREENGFLRSDLMALHSGMAAEEEAMSGGGGAGRTVSEPELGGDGTGDAAGGGGKTPSRARFSSPARSNFKKQLQRSMSASKGSRLW